MPRPVPDPRERIVGAGRTAAIELPPFKPLESLAAAVHREELAGSARWTVTTRDGIAPARRTWHRSHAEALTWAASEADRLGLALFDLSDPAEAA